MIGLIVLFTYTAIYFTFFCFNWSMMHFARISSLISIFAPFVPANWKRVGFLLIWELPRLNAVGFFKKETTTSWGCTSCFVSLSYAHHTGCMAHTGTVIAQCLYNIYRLTLSTQGVYLLTERTVPEALLPTIVTLKWLIVSILLKRWAKPILLKRWAKPILLKRWAKPILLKC